MKKQAIFTGTHCTGKSTILSMMEASGYNVIMHNVIRDMSKNNEIDALYNNSTEESQQRIFDRIMTILIDNKDEDYVSDRGLIDVVAYSIANNLSIVPLQLKELKKFSEENRGIVYFYFPIEFPIVEDGVRSTDEGYRRRVDESIVAIADMLRIPLIRVEGNVEERYNYVKEFMAVMGKPSFNPFV